VVTQMKSELLLTEPLAKLSIRDAFGPCTVPTQNRLIPSTPSVGFLRLESTIVADIQEASLDGYPYAGMGRSGFKSFPSLNRPEKLKHHIASRCQIDRKQCFSPIQIAPGGVLKSSDIFKHVTYRAVHCGDCSKHCRSYTCLVSL